MAFLKKSAKEPPTNKVLELRSKGFTNTQIIDQLQKESFSQQEISDAINQADIKNTIEFPSPEDPQIEFGLMDAPSPSGLEEHNQSTSIQNQPQQRSNQSLFTQPKYSSQEIFSSRESDIERLQELTESIIQEKWEDLMKSVGDITMFKEKVRSEIISIKQEIIRTQERFDTLQKAVLGKVTEYDKDVKEVGSEIKALEKVLERIIEPLSTNIRELQKVTQEIKATRLTAHKKKGS